MRNKILLVLIAVSFIILCSVGLFSATRAQNIQTRVIEGFEKMGTWEVKFSKFRSPQFSRRQVGYTHPSAQNQQNVRPEDSQSWLSWFTANERDFSFLPDGLPPDVRGRTEKRIMGVRASYEIKGYNWVVVQPKKELKLYGIVKSLDCWIWGAGYSYDIAFIVKDYFGFYHTLNAGTLKHYGWKNFRVRIPGWIPQRQPWLPRTRPLKFVRFKITSRPYAREDNFHVYFDYMQVQTDIYRERFNGDNLVNLDWKRRGVRGNASASQQQSGQQGSQAQPTQPTPSPAPTQPPARQ